HADGCSLRAVEVLSKYLAHPYAEIGAPLIIVLGIAGYWIARKVIDHREQDYREAYRKRQIVLTLVVVSSAISIVILWARLLQRTGTFLGLVAGGIAIALREPLLAIAGRIAILTGRIYTVGDRIQVEQLT